MMTTLQQLGENAEGNFQAFETYSNAMMNQFKLKKNVDGQAVVLLEECAVEYYKNNLDAALEKALNALGLSKTSQNPEYLAGRAEFYVTAVQRKDKKLGSAYDWVQRAKLHLSSVEPGEDTAETLFNEAKCMMALTVGNQSTAVRMQAIDFLEKSILHYKMEPDGFCENEIRRCLVNIASLYLGQPTTPAGRTVSDISRSDVQNAEKCLTIIRERYWTDVTKRNELQVLFTESGLHYRKKLYGIAIVKVEEAIKIALDCKFTSEIEYCTDFLQFLQQKFNSTRRQVCRPGLKLSDFLSDSATDGD